MNYNEIIKALTIIKNICDDCICETCPFMLDDTTCGITDDEPSNWHIKSLDNWRAFE